MLIKSAVIPYCIPSVGEEEIAEVVDSLRSGFLSSGPKVRRFEDDFARYVGVESAVAVNSCTSALTVALAALEIGPGDEVIVPTLTFCATANVLEHLGATPIIVDVEGDLQISPQAVQSALSSRTRAILAVHYGGQACALSRIFDIANERGIPVLQDAAHAVGATHLGKKIGGEGLATAFSFYPSKNMTTGEGGMLTTNDSYLARRFRQLALHGIHRLSGTGERSSSWAYEVREPGYKANLTDIQAAIGIWQLRKLDGFIDRRREIAAQYGDALARSTGIGVPGDLPGRPHTYHLYPLRIIAGQAPVNRDMLRQRLWEWGVATSLHYIPVHRQPFYSNKYGHLNRSYPVADQASGELVSLPLYPAMSDADVRRVIDATCEAMMIS